MAIKMLLLNLLAILMRVMKLYKGFNELCKRILFFTFPVVLVMYILKSL